MTLCRTEAGREESADIPSRECLGEPGPALCSAYSWTWTMSRSTYQASMYVATKPWDESPTSLLRDYAACGHISRFWECCMSLANLRMPVFSNELPFNSLLVVVARPKIGPKGPLYHAEVPSSLQIFTRSILTAGHLGLAVKF